MAYDISVQTLIYRGDVLFADLGTMRWFGVSEKVRWWLAGSCKTTAFWLIGLSESTRPDDDYTLKYRTRIDANGMVVSDTGLLEFPHLSYVDLIRFERWAVNQLTEMTDLFADEHVATATSVRHRSKFRAIMALAWQRLHLGESK